MTQWELMYGVIEGASTKPFGYMPFFPILVSEDIVSQQIHFILFKAKEYGVPTKFRASCEINTKMPEYAFQRRISFNLFEN